MTPKNHSLFSPFRFDAGNECLWRGKQRVALTPKAFAVLHYLMKHPGQLVTKGELLDAVWPDVSVSEGVIKFCMREIRQALGDDAQAPRFIETLHRRGYRFIAKVQGSRFKVQSQKQSRVQEQENTPAPNTQHPTPPLMGREVELTKLHCWLEKALHGERQIIFVTGEAGIGKTALVEAFLKGIGDWGLEVEEENQKAKGKNQKAKVEAQSPAPSTQHLTPRVWLGWGQCIEHYGAGEAYMPVLEALGRLCREPGGQRFIALLDQHAPTWLVQMPALLSTPQLATLQRKMAGATQERMLREMAEALEALTGAGAVREPLLLVLVLEDLQWSDHSTLELIATLARRREKARLLMIGTQRPVETLETEHPLRVVMQELHLHQQCKELQLGLLVEASVTEYLETRFSVGARRAAPLQQLARTVHQRTEGNPLFMVNVVDYLIARGVLVEHRGQWGVRQEEEQLKVPENLQQMIVKQIERLSPEEQRVLEVASVAGAEFSAAAVAAAVEAEISEVEETCERLARRAHFLRASGVSEWPDGTVAARYGFLHALYQEVLYERVTAGRRIRLHQRIGEREETAYGAQARELATELAMHFERGRDYQRAVQYLQQAGENAQRRSAHREAIHHLTKGLELLKTLPDTPYRIQQELMLQITLGPSLISTKGYGVPEVEHAYTRARELSRQVGETPQLLSALLGLSVFHMTRAEYQTAREFEERCVDLAQSIQDPILLREAHTLLGQTLFFLGEFAPARVHLEQGIALYHPQQPRQWIDNGVGCLSTIAWTLWLCGYPDQARKRNSEALTLAQEFSHPFSTGFALFFASGLHQLRQETRATQERAEMAITLSTEQGFPTWLANGTVLRGWALAMCEQCEEGIAQLGQGLAAHRATGEEVVRSHFLALLAEAYGKAGQIEEGLTVLAEALAVVDRTGERHYEAELYRLAGELLLRIGEMETGRSEDAEKETEKRRRKTLFPSPIPRFPDSFVKFPFSSPEACFFKAIELARKQQAKSLELRATMSLARLWQRQDKQHEARRILSDIYNWFTEGFDTKDLQEAKALLTTLT